MTRSIIFEKMKLLHFPSLKNDFEVKECSNYYQSKALIIYNSKHMHNFVIGSIDHPRFGFEVACWHFKKRAFLKALGVPKTKKYSGRFEIKFSLSNCSVM